MKLRVIVWCGLLVGVVVFSAALDGMERDIIEDQDPHNIVDLFQNDGRYLKELITQDCSVHYCHDFAIAQKTLKLFLGNGGCKQ